MEHAVQPATRRHLLLLAGSLPVLAALKPALAAQKPLVTVWKDPRCGCCTAWAGHLRQAGFAAETVASADLPARRAALGVPPALAGCHTAEVEGHAIEGHVPAEAIDALLAGRPAVQGLAVPGMPAGSPGMPSSRPDTYDVLAFDASGYAWRFMRFRGPERIEA